MGEKGARPRAVKLDIVLEESGEEAGGWLTRRLSESQISDLMSNKTEL